MCPQQQRIQLDILEFENLDHNLLIEPIEVLKVPGPLVSCSEGVATGHGATLQLHLHYTLHYTLHLRGVPVNPCWGGVMRNVCSSQRKPRQNHFKTPMFGIVLA